MSNSGLVKIYNKGKQAIRLQVRPPGGDFYKIEQQIAVNVGKSVILPKSHLLWEQVENLQKSGFLRVTE